MSNSAHLPSIPDFPAIVHSEFLFALDTFCWASFGDGAALLGGINTLKEHRNFYRRDLLYSFAYQTGRANIMWTTR